ncbi:MAG: Hpt domain-containing protein [Desulfobulbus sp.]|jgi:two-component system chemotaxis sensor kinase CheA|uniref:ATP-binding protein n=1 Tax=Desulfobulbus sp. TaxID=895 RepID=UPI0028481C67|nr:ATP-binding protein [Desulfobulbus sp.]MDR2550777.1 Hpt domain-containing protein [Desulfobulbus sp.]
MEEDSWQPVAAFIDTSLEMIGRVQPFVRALAAQPAREDIAPKVIGFGFRLFHFIKGKSLALGFDHLASPAAAMEYLLDQLRSGGIPLSPAHISLLDEACGFFERGMAVVREERSDQCLAAAASGFASVLRQAALAQDDAGAGEGTGCGLPEEEREAFLWEMEHLVGTAEQECVLWDFIVVDLDRVTELSRLLSRMKQYFTLYGFHDPERICLSMASTLNRFVQGECFQTEYPERVLLRSLDAIRTALAAFPANHAMAVADLERHLASLQGLMRQPLGELLIEAGLADAATIDQALAVQRSDPEGQPRLLGEVLVDLGRVTSAQIEHALREQHDKRALALEAEDVCDAGERIAPESPLAVAIDGRKLERVHLLLEQLVPLRLPEQHQEYLAELQEIVRSWRRDALASLAGRLQRVVHDLAAASGKRVRFIVEGIEALKETGQAAVLADSLFHLLRNSVEHGLELVEERTHSGKKTIGRLHLLILRQGEEIWLSVEDDGRGFDGERMDALLIGRGQLTAADLGQLTNKERFVLLSSKPSQPSEQEHDGEPGLVAVRRNLRTVGGTMDAITRPGKGTCVTLRVPRRP